MDNNKTSRWPTPLSQQIETTEGKPVVITLSAFDPNKDDKLTASILHDPMHGNLSQIDQTAGIVTYTPDQGFSGHDRFNFLVSDSEKESLAAEYIFISVTDKR
jgi:hypothetical protein